MADDLVDAVYIGGDLLVVPATGARILPGETHQVPAEVVDLEGGVWASSTPKGQVRRLELLAKNIRAAARGEPVADDPLAHGADPAPAADPTEE